MARAAFKDGATTFGAASLTADGIGAHATFTYNGLSLGAHSITAVYGGATYFVTSTSPPLSQNIILLTTHSFVTSSVNPSAAVQPFVFTAEVDGQFGETPTGTVTFMDGTTTLGTGTLTPGGMGALATLAASFLVVGDHPITVSYGGDSTHAVSTSAALPQTVHTATTTTSLATSVNPSITGNPVTFTVHVVAQFGGTLTGTVSFLDGTTTLGMATLTPDANGASATFTYNGLSLGFHSITAMYVGDASFDASTSAALTQHVRTATTTAVTPSVNPSSAFQTVTFTAEVDGQTGGPPTGNVTFYDNGSFLTTLTLTPYGLNARATFTTSALAVGPHPITVSYSGDATFADSNLPELTQTVQQAPTTTTVVASADPSLVGNPVTFTVQVNGQFGGTPTGTVNFMDGTSLIGMGTLTSDAQGAQAVFTTSDLAIADHPITAFYSGDATFLGGTSVVLNQTVQAPTMLYLSSNVNPTPAGQPVTFMVYIAAGSYGPATGTVSFLDGATTLGTATLIPAGPGASTSFTTSALVPGVHTITAVYAGQDIFAASTASWDETVQMATSFTTLSADVNPAGLGQVVTFTATVAPTSGPLPWTPTGTVTFMEGSTTLGTGGLDQNGHAVFSKSDLSPGNHSISAVYGGDATYSGSTSFVLTQTVADTTSDLSYTVLHDTKLSVGAPLGVLAGDGPSVQAVLETETQHGTVILNTDGSFNYQPNPGYVGDDSFTYVAQSPTQTSQPGTVTVSVTDQAPDAPDDSFQVHAGTTLNAVAPGLGEVATDPDFDTLTFQLVSGTTHGALTWNGNGTFVYTPAVGFVGDDTFTYSTFDGALSSSTVGTVTITVEDLMPTAAPASFDVAAGGTLFIGANQSLLVSSFAPEGDLLQAVLITGPMHRGPVRTQCGRHVRLHATRHAASILRRHGLVLLRRDRRHAGEPTRHGHAKRQRPPASARRFLRPQLGRHVDRLGGRRCAGQRLQPERQP